MSASQHLYRMDSNITGIEHKQFASGSITEDVDMMNRWDNRISLLWNQRRRFVSLLGSKWMHSCKSQKLIIANNPFNPDFVVLDYAGDMKSGIAGVSDYDAGSFGVIYSSLKELAANLTRYIQHSNKARCQEG